jgi:hypothetical protein
MGINESKVSSAENGLSTIGHSMVPEMTSKRKQNGEVSLRR